MSARPFIDSLDFALNGKEIRGVVQVAELLRLSDVLNDTQGELAYTVRGGQDKQGVPSLEIDVAGQCELLCQRCLAPLAYPVRLETRLMLRDQAALDALGDDEDEFDSVLAEAQLDVWNLLEEEVLLSLPIAPRHEPGVCKVAGGENVAESAKHPFAALAKLKVVK
ncbi:MAG: YceD family protein [Gallionella sp.]|nr:YceD family protein [Gallionella sp.]